MDNDKRDKDWMWAMGVAVLCAVGCLAPGEVSDTFQPLPEVQRENLLNTDPGYFLARPGEPIVLRLPDDAYLEQVLREQAGVIQRDLEGVRFAFSETTGVPVQWVHPDDERLTGVAGLAYGVDGYPEQWQLYAMLFSRALRAYEFRNNLATAMRHELGHTLGAFGHLEEWGGLMSQSANYAERVDQPSGEFLCAVYGCEVAP